MLTALRETVREFRVFISPLPSLTRRVSAGDTPTRSVSEGPWTRIEFPDGLTALREHARNGKTCPRRAVGMAPDPFLDALEQLQLGHLSGFKKTPQSESEFPDFLDSGHTACRKKRMDPGGGRR
jgi:hypothetical protein